MESIYPDLQDLLLVNRIVYFANGTKLLDEVSFSVRLSSIHVVVGEHGAGKTTLAKALSGYLEPEQGSIALKGNSYRNCNRPLMRSLGINSVFAESALINSLSIVDNFFLAADSQTLFPRYIPYKKRIDECSSILKRYDIEVKPTALVEDLSEINKLKVEIVKVLYYTSTVLILDNILERLPSTYYSQFFSIIEKARKLQGLTIILFTENIDEVYEIADDISIIRDGRILLSEKVEQISRLHLLRLTYSQLAQYNPIGDAKRNFTHLLKYNEAILNSLPINLIVIGPERNIQIINKYAVSYFNVGKKTVIGGAIDSLFGTANDEVRGLLKDALNESEPQTYVNVPILFENRKTLNVIKTFPIIDGPVTIGYMVIIEDITEQEGMRTQLNLSERLASVGLLATGVAHEINTPLGTMRNYIDTLRMDEEDSGVLGKLRELDEQISYIAKIIENLVLFSESKEGPKERFDINDVIRELCRFLRKSMEEKKIQIELNLVSESMIMYGYKSEMKRVMMNLLKNSAESIGEVGKIIIASESKKKNNLNVHEITVRDTGAGIDEGAIDKIFFPFFSTKKSGKNYGLGLYVSYQIIENMGGSIVVESPKGSGITFRLELPGD